MKYAIIDMGSNSMRLCVYEIQNNGFKIIFKQKIIAGLAGYVKDDVLLETGIQCAYNGLLEFRETLEALDIKNVSVFATASLRNINNTKEAVEKISIASGYEIKVLSEDEEAILGYMGANYETKQDAKCVIDIGGASTEISLALENGDLDGVSFPIGSLKLYKDCVRKVLPQKGSIYEINEKIFQTIQIDKIPNFSNCDVLLAVGGTARAVLKIAIHLLSLSEDTTKISRENFDEVCKYLLKCKKKSFDLILKIEPDRIHTMITGILILKHLVNIFDAKEIAISKYGAREGYLCRYILSQK